MEWQPPLVSVGDTVRWKPSPDYPEWFALYVLTKDDDGRIGGLFYAMNEGGISGGARDGVRHVSDPALRDPSVLAIMAADGEMGVWEHSETVLSLMQRIKDLEGGEKSDVQLDAPVVFVPPKGKGGRPRKQPEPAEEFDPEKHVRQEKKDFDEHDLSPEEQEAKRAALAVARAS